MPASVRDFRREDYGFYLAEDGFSQGREDRKEKLRIDLTENEVSRLIVDSAYHIHTDSVQVCWNRCTKCCLHMSWKVVVCVPSGSKTFPLSIAVRRLKWDSGPIWLSRTK